MRLLISILLFTCGFGLNAQTFWSSREYRIPGLGPKSLDIGMRFSSIGESDTTLLSIGYGWESSKNKNLEWGVTGAIGATDLPVDNFSNFELGGDLTYKHEKILQSGAKVVPYVRGGLTFNHFSNYEETTVGYTWTHRYYYASGDMYWDFYGNYTAGLSYIGVENKWAVSTEMGQYQSLFGDLDLGYEDTIWTSQIYFKLGETSGIKLMYSVESDSEMETIGVYWSKVW